MSFIDRKNNLIDAISSSYAKILREKYSISNIQGININDIECGNNSACEDCLSLYLDKSILTSTKDSDVVFRNNIRDGICNGACVCKIDGLTLRNNIFVTSETGINISDDDKSKIIDDVIATYKDVRMSISRFKILLRNIINRTNEKIITNIEQMCMSNQIISIKGTGYDVKNINILSTVNAVMRALIDDCATNDDTKKDDKDDDKKDNTKKNIKNNDTNTDDGCAVKTLNDIVTEEMNYIRDSVNTNVVNEFKYAWQQTKKYFIITGIILLILVVIISGMLIYKALHPNIS
jgi:hypothetical protein